MDDIKFMEEIAAMIAADESAATIENGDKVKMLETVGKAAKKFAKQQGLTIKKELHTPFQSVGAVSIEGKEIAIINPRAFVDATRVASNFEVYPKMDGTVHMDFTFHGLTKKGDN